MKKIALILMLITIISKILGFGREIVLAYYFGATNISDAYLISQTIPGTIFEFIGIAISTSFIPIYTTIISRGEEEDAQKFTNNLVNLLVIISLLIVVIINIFTEPVVKLFASGFDNTTLALAMNFTKISVCGICFTALSYVFRSYLEIKNKFLLTALAGIPYNVVLVIAIILGAKYNNIYLSLGSLAAVILQFLILVHSAFKQGYKYYLGCNFKEQNIKKMLYLSIPVTLGVSVNQINKLVDRTMASRITIGGISSLNYANRLNHFVQGIFVVSIITVIYPRISKMIVTNDMDGFKKVIANVIGAINLIVIPLMVGSLIFAGPIVELLFGRGAFDTKAMEMTANTLFFYSIGMMGTGVREIVSRAFYSMGDTKTPMINAAIGMALNIVLNLVLAKYLGIGGLALATSISATFIAALLIINLRKKIGSFGIKKVSISFFKILIASLFMGIISKVSFNYLLISLSQNISLLIAISIGVSAYFTIIYFMNIEGSDIIIVEIKKRLAKNR